MTEEEENQEEQTEEDPGEQPGQEEQTEEEPEEEDPPLIINRPVVLKLVWNRHDIEYIELHIESKNLPEAMTGFLFLESRLGILKKEKKPNDKEERNPVAY